MTETTPPTDEPIVIKRPMTWRGCAWRLGCLVVWLPLILLPLVLFALAVQGEVALWHNDSFPSGEEHPFLQAKLLMDIDTRGLNLTRSFIASSEAGDNAVCVQTQVRFFLWQGSGDPVDYCDCYARDDGGEPWMFVERYPGVCE